jgi:transposase
MLTDELDFAIGVDTHVEAHTLVIIDARTQRSCELVAVQANRSGYRRALTVARRRARGRRIWAVEGTGCYGAGLARFLAGHGERVREIERPKRVAAGRRGKSDPIDAERAARELLAGSAGSRPRDNAETRALAALLVARESAVVQRTATVNELRALIVSGPSELRERLQRLPAGKLLSACAALRSSADRERAAYVLALRSLAQRALRLREEADTLEREIHARAQVLAPQLLAQAGIGTISAAQLLISWSHRGRLRSEAAFARLAGAAPIPASSGKTVRHRLDRGGDRQLNRALHTILLTRRRQDPATRAYINRRLSEGKTQREAIRCLKRYLARSLYRQLEHQSRTT